MNYRLKDGGYFDAEGKVHYFVTDYQGNVVEDRKARGAVVASTQYYPYGEPWTEPAGDNDRWFGGKERLAAEGLPMSDFGPRLLNHAYPAWLSQDRKLEVYYHLSPYSYCAGNPIRYVDPTGEEPTFLESALMASVVYTDSENDRKRLFKISKWRISTDLPQILRADGSESGLRTLLFEKANSNGEKEYAYVFRGTEPITAWSENRKQLKGKSKEYADAVAEAKVTHSAIGNSELTFIGHSKGGGEAAAASMATGRKAITFNPAALHPRTISKLGLGSASQVTNYVIGGINIVGSLYFYGDIVYSVQKNLLNLTPPGKTIFIPGFTINPHSINSFTNLK